MLALPRITEPDENMVHYESYPSQDAVTLCNMTDFLGQTPGKPTRKPVTCCMCRNIVKWVQSHKREFEAAP